MKNKVYKTSIKTNPIRLISRKRIKEDKEGENQKREQETKSRKIRNRRQKERKREITQRKHTVRDPHEYGQLIFDKGTRAVQ